MNTPRVTIGIPCLNAKRWLSESIRSALQQTWKNKEVIVVDNGSTDSSLNIIKSFGDSIRFFVIPKRGANFARNEILRQATGQWVQFLDADDYLGPHKISCQLEEARSLDQVGVLYSPVIIEEHGSRSVSKIDSHLDLASQWISWQLPQTGACLWRKTTLDALGGWNESMPCCQEHELYLRAIQADVLFEFTPTAHAVYRIWSDETLCRKDPVLVIRTRTILIDQMLDWLEQLGRLNPRHRSCAGRAFFEMARTMARHNLSAATEYVEEKKERCLLELRSPAAPLLYRACFHVFGFGAAEIIARLLRR